MTTYSELVERNFKVLGEEWFGDYQGDTVFLVEGSEGLGVIIIGYGSCSGCDWLESVDYYDNPDREKELNDITLWIVENVHYGTKEELLEYLLGEESRLKWYGNEDTFEGAVNNLFKTAGLIEG